MQSMMSEYATADVVTAAKQKKEKPPDLRFLFDLYDTDKSGDLDLDELRNLASEMGKELTERELQDAIDEMDEDGGGTVCFPEFAEWWTSSNSLLKQHLAKEHAPPPTLDRLLTGLSLPDLQELRQWGFPCLSYTQEQLCGMALMMFTDSELDICQDFDVSPDTVMKRSRSSSAMATPLCRTTISTTRSVFSRDRTTWLPVWSCAGLVPWRSLRCFAGMGHDADTMASTYTSTSI